MAAVKKRGLGRGLDALLDPYVELEVEKKDSIREIDINLIDTNDLQPRKSFDEESLKELADSIKKHGIIQPLIVKEKDGRFLIVAGERRYRAARIAKIKKIPVLTVEYDDQTMQEVALIENIQRENLNPVEEASAIRFLMQQHDLTQEEVSDRIGKSRPVVANSLRLLQLPEPVLEMIKEGKLSAGHGRTIAGVKDAKNQTALAEECVQYGYSVRELENRIKKNASGKEKKKTEKKCGLSGDMKQMEDLFREKLGAKIKLTGNEEKGKIILEYATREQLQQIYDCITK